MFMHIRREYYQFSCSSPVSYLNLGMHHNLQMVRQYTPKTLISYVWELDVCHTLLISRSVLMPVSTTLGPRLFLRVGCCYTEIP